VNVLAITSSYPRYEGDPTAPFIESITRHVAARGHAVHMLVPAHRLWRRPPVEGNIHFHTWQYSPVRSWTPWGYAASLEAGVRIRRPLYALAPIVTATGFRAASSLLARSNFDLVHVHWVIPNGPIGAAAARRHGLPLIVSLHGSDISVAERVSALGRAARICFERAAVVTAPSEDLLARAGRLGARGRLELVPYGADVEALEAEPGAGEAVRERLGLGRDQIVVAGIGRFVHWKGFNFLVEAFAKAARTVPELRLVFVGDGDLRDALGAHARSLGVVENVTFVGLVTREEMPAYLAATDIVAVPSIHYDGYVDGLPNVALEAMGAGKALVASRVGGLPQLVRSGENGLLVEEQDADALAEAIVTLARDPELRQRLGSHGRRVISESMTWDDVATRFEAVYKDARKSQRVAPRRPTGPVRAHRSPPTLRVLYFGTFERDYPRNAQVISCLRVAGVDVVERHLPVWEGRRHKFSAGIGALAQTAAAEARLALSSAEAADVLLVGYPGHMDLLAAGHVARGRPVVFNPLVSLEDTMVDDRGLVASRSLSAWALRAVDRYAFRHADLVVADTAAHARFFVERFGLSDDRAAVCFLGAEDRLFRPGPRPECTFHALFVGKLIPLHGIETILSAARLCREIEFRIVGSGQLEHLLANRPSNVRWEPWVEYDRLPDRYRAAGCALGIFGMTHKAMRVIPNKAFQALATATPLVTADTPASRELLNDGHDALLVPSGDPSALADAVQRLAADHELRGMLGAGGRATYDAHAAEEVLGRRWRTLLERLLTRGRGAVVT
jgi:glycosyltransferase involved in cell wall biosynthesis